MEIVWSILSILLVLTGILGAVLPIIPGPLLSFFGIAVLLLDPIEAIEYTDLAVWAIFAVLVTALDYLVPAWGTKKLGGSSYGVRGSIAGLIVGFFFPPIGIILGPFLGALVGEMIYQRNTNQALRSALGSFVGFLIGTGLKLMYGFFAAFYSIQYIVGYVSLNW